ncbi:hypothetical protein C0995_004117 [Termitomyces sp. Mi166|nr:hypothetical protein C0995_004117 [Termitomyces sp. Mi166\
MLFLTLVKHVSIDQQLVASNKNMNIVTKTLRYRQMVEKARSTHHTCLRLVSKVQRASTSAQQEENNKPANIMAKAEEAAIAFMERKVRLYEAMQKYQRLFGSGRQ